jgi:hypothetical protein
VSGVSVSGGPVFALSVLGVPAFAPLPHCVVVVSVSGRVVMAVLWHAASLEVPVPMPSRALQRGITSSGKACNDICFQRRRR